MEALSGAASGIAVVSLTIQLIQSVALIREFIEDVKGASKELHRLVGKLELLAALLENVQYVLEQQSSLSRMHFPAPSVAIFKCLKGCEDSIQPLVDIVKKLSLPQSRSSSSTARLKSEIKLALKTKELTTLETRIQHDIDLLNTSLSVNQNSILMNLFPILLRNQETMLKSNNSPPVAFIPCSDLGTIVKTLDTVSLFASSPVRYSQQTILVRSAFERLGLYRRKVIRYQDQRTEDSEGNVKSYTRDIIWTANEVSAMWKFLGFGVTFTQQQPYGRIFPSLRTYPVIDFGAELFDIMYEESVHQLQERISSGALHPFMRNPRGFSLLHYAAMCYRPDLCRLLLGYGVKPEPTSEGRSPLSVAMTCPSGWTSRANRTDIYQCFLDDLDLTDEINKVGSQTTGRMFWFGTDEAQWLWQRSSEMLLGEDLRSVRRIIIRGFWSGLANVNNHLRHDARLPDIPMDEDILSDIQYGRCEILRDVLPWWWDMQSSYILGTRFVDWLVSLDLDSELCVDSERAYLEGSPESGNKRIVLERNWEQKWVLGFEWVFDHQIPGYSLLSEYTVLVVEDTWGRTEWPVYGSGYWSAPGTPSAQFKRRMAVKERKERARLGRKQPRSRIPGAWKW